MNIAVESYPRKLIKLTEDLTDHAQHDRLPHDGDARTAGHRPDPHHQRLLRHGDDPHHGRHLYRGRHPQDPPRWPSGSLCPQVPQINRAVIFHSLRGLRGISQPFLTRWLAIFTFSSYPPIEKQLENLEKGFYR